MYFFLVFIMFQSTFSFPADNSIQKQNFIAPVYELGSYIPPVPLQGDITPGKPAQIVPQIGVDTRIDEENEKPPQKVPPVYVLGSNPPISSIQPWKPIQIIPPEHSNGVDKTTKRPSGAGFTGSNNSNNSNNNNGVDSINLEYKPSRPSFHPNPGNNVAQIIPSDGLVPSKVDINDRIKDDNYDGYHYYDDEYHYYDDDKKENQGANYADKYPYYMNQKPTEKPTSLEYKPNRPSYAGSPKN